MYSEKERRGGALFGYCWVGGMNLHHLLPSKIAARSRMLWTEGSKELDENLMIIRVASEIFESEKRDHEPVFEEE